MFNITTPEPVLVGFPEFEIVTVEVDDALYTDTPEVGATKVQLLTTKIPLLEKSVSVYR